MIPIIRYLKNTQEKNAIYIDSTEALDGHELKDGHKILLKRGEIYRTILSIAKDNVKIGSYGTGLKPILSGSTIAQSWTNEGDNVFSTNCDTVKWVYKDGERFEIAKSNYRSSTSRPNPNQIAADSTYFNTFTNLVGCKMRVIEYRYRMSFEHTIVSYSNGLFQLDRDIINSPSGYYFFIYDHIEFLKENSWYYDYINQKLYIKLPSGIAPETLLIEYGTKDDGIVITGNNVQIENIALQHYQKSAIREIAAGGMTVENCEIKECRGSGVYLSKNGIGHHKIIDCEIHDIANNGIRAGATDFVEIGRNHIYNIGLGADLGWPHTDALLNFPGIIVHQNHGETDDVQKMTGLGIHSDFDYHEDVIYTNNFHIHNNHIHDIAWQGIRMMGDNHLIEHNIVHRFAQRWSDVAGIGTFAGTVEAYSQASCKDSIIRNNIVRDYYKDPQFSFMVNITIVGIYIDMNSDNIEVCNNVIYKGGDTGIYSYQYAKNMNIHHNIIAFIGVCELKTFSNSNVGVKVYDNIIFNRGNKLTVDVGATYFSSGGGADRNIYINPYLANAYRFGGVTYDFTGWKVATGYDFNSINKDGYNIGGNPNVDCLVYYNESPNTIQQLIPYGYEDVNGNDLSDQYVPIPSRFSGLPGIVVLKTF